MRLLALSRRSIPALALPVALLLLAACEKAKEPSPGEQMFRLGVTTRFSCPVTHQNAGGASGALVSIVPAVGTVFAKDGQVATNVPVNMSIGAAGSYFVAHGAGADATHLTGDGSITVNTNAAGQAIADAVIPQMSSLDVTFDHTGYPVTITGSLPARPDLVQTTSVYLPYGPIPGATTSATSVKVGDKFTLTLTGSFVCNVAAFDAQVHYDTSLLELDPDSSVNGIVEGGVLNLDAATAPCTTAGVCTQLDPGAAPGSGLIDIHYRRLLTVQSGSMQYNSGVSADGAFVKITFKAKAAGTVTFTDADASDPDPNNWIKGVTFWPGEGWSQTGAPTIDGTHYENMKALQGTPFTITITS